MQIPSDFKEASGSEVSEANHQCRATCCPPRITVRVSVVLGQHAVRVLWLENNCSGSSNGRPKSAMAAGQALLTVHQQFPPAQGASRPGELDMYFRNQTHCAALWCDCLWGSSCLSITAQHIEQAKEETEVKITEIKSTNEALIKTQSSEISYDTSHNGKHICKAAHVLLSM